MSRLSIVLFLLTVVSGTAVGATPPRMIEETAGSGISHQYTGGWAFFVGGGVAVFDCNADGYPDVFLAGGSSASALYVNASSRGGVLSFRQSTDPVTDMTDVTGAYPLDIDGDGQMDIAVLRQGKNVLLRGRGGCRFARANDDWTFDGGKAWTTGMSATWESDQRWPTLAVGNYVDRSKPGSPWGTCHDNSLFRPNAAGTGFAVRHRLTPGYCSLSVLFSDWNRSGIPDLRISNDRQYYKGGQEQLWVVAPGKAPRLRTVQEGWQKLKIWGMGIATRDLTGDGYPEYFLTSMGDNKLRTLAKGAGRPTYKDMARQVGVTAHRPFIGTDVLPSTAWHAQFEDVNNDGFVDLFVAKGNVEAMKDFASADPNNLLLGGADGRFAEAADVAGLASTEKARGAAVVDFNLDGLPDVLVVNRRANVQIWRNVGRGTADHVVPMGNWIGLQIQQPGDPNRNAVGAWIEVRSGTRTQRTEIVVGGGHASGQAGWHHFGVGVAERLTVRIQWPDGEWSPWLRLFANQFARISRGNTEARLWLPSQQAGGQ